jgi:hypothetical protein
MASYPPGKLWLALQWALIGYGYRIERAWFWVLGLIILGAWLLKLSKQGDEDSLLYRGAYSLDMAFWFDEMKTSQASTRLIGIRPLRGHKWKARQARQIIE